MEPRKAWNLPENRHTPESTYAARGLHRRELLKLLGLSTAGLLPGGIAGCSKPTPEEIEQAGIVELPPAESDDPKRFSDLTGHYPATRNADFEYGRAETAENEAAQWTNFFEFSASKDVWKHVDRFEPLPWTIEIDGLCSNPLTLDFDDLHRRVTLEERAYRFRCVETWAMCVPWTGFPLRDLLKLAEPQPRAKFVRFETFHRPDQAARQRSGSGYTWPYEEGLTMAEATNPLTLIATGIYGHLLPKQHGSPLRLVVPWKYGFKSIKSIVRISLTDRRPATFWNTVAPHEYGFEANVDPTVPHPRWSQSTEWMLGTREKHPTQPFNGYGEYVASLY